jgi:hypothetical protein
VKLITVVVFGQIVVVELSSIEAVGKPTTLTVNEPVNDTVHNGVPDDVMLTKLYVLFEDNAGVVTVAVP